MFINPRRLALAWRLLMRDWRAGELRLLFSALVIAVAATSAIGFFTDRLQRGMVNQSAELFGADLLLQSPRPIDEQWLAQAQDMALRQTTALEFPSVVIHADNLHLSSIKAVSQPFPLRGQLRISTSASEPEQVTQAIPAPGEAWINQRLLHLLQIELGERIEFGDTDLKVSRLLTFEPGSSANIMGLAPRVLINQADLERAGVIQAGSRVSYQYLFAGDEAALARYKRWLKPRLTPSHSLVDVRGGRPTVGVALERAERYLGLASLIAVLLAGVAIAMGARRYSERHFDVSAVMRCVGATQDDIVSLFGPQLLIVGVAGSLLGVLLGFVVQFGLFYLLAELLPAQLPSPGPKPALLGLLTGLVVLGGFALPPILRLKQVPALRVLRRELTPLPLSAWLVYGLAGAAMSVLMWRYTNSAQLTLIVLGGSAAALTGLGGMAWLLLRLSRGLHCGVGVAWRYGLNNLWRRPWLSVSQILAFGLALMAMAVIALVRGDLLTTWQTQLPADAPNHFVVNLQPERVAAFRDFLDRHQIASAQLYPMVRGRLVQINDDELGSRIQPGDRGAGAVNRELNLTWSDTLQADNVIVEGRWWQAGDDGKHLVSMEAELAQRLGVKLGDTLHFSFGEQQLSAEVISLRTVKWDSFRPNFFMIFPPGVIEHLPAMYMTSFYLDPTRDRSLAEMVREFPSLTVVDLEQLMAQVRRILNQVTLAVEYVLIFVLLAGFAVLYAALQASLDERLYEGALLRTLGASRQQLRNGHLAEYALLGLLAGLLAAGGTELIAYLLYSRVFQLDYSLKWILWLSLPALGALLIGSAGYLGTRHVVNRSPLVVLREL